MRYVYLAGPIAGCNIEEANAWRESIKVKFEPNIIGISPLRCEPPRGKEKVYEVTKGTKDKRAGTPGAIGAKNYLDVESADIVLAYLPRELNERRPSYGTTLEIGWAIVMQKPVIIVSDDPYINAHPLFKWFVPWIVPTLDEGVMVINDLLGDYVNGN